MKIGIFYVLNIPISILISIIKFMKYLLPVEPKLLPKSSEFVEIWYRQYVKYTILSQKWIFWIIYHLQRPNFFKKSRCPEFIEIWYFKNVDHNLNVKKDLFKCLPPVRLRLFTKLKKCFKFLRIRFIWYFKYTDFDFHVKTKFMKDFTAVSPSWSQE